MLLLFGVWGFALSSFRWPTSDDLHLGWLFSWAPASCMLLAAVAAHWLVVLHRNRANHRSANHRSGTQNIPMVSASASATTELKETRKLTARASWYAEAMPVSFALLAVLFQWGEFYDLSRRELVGRLDVYAQPDLRYLAAVGARIQRLRSDSRRFDADQRVVLEQVERDVATWTARRVTQASELSEQLASLRVLAFDVYPREVERSSVEGFVEVEARSLKQELVACQLEQQRVEGQLAEQSAELESLRTQSTLEEALVAGEAAESTVVAQRGAVAASLTQLEMDAQALKRTQQALAARQAWRASFPLESAGLNARYPWLALPVSLPGGAAWSGSYTVFVGLHTVYVMVGLLITGCWRSAEEGVTGVAAADKACKLSFMRIYWTLTALAVLAGCWLL